MTPRRRSAITAASLWLLVGCAPTPRPRIMEEVDDTRASAAAQEASRLAPQDFARAQQLEKRAEQALSDDDTSGAQILSEHAIAAYNHAFVVARLVKAERRRTAAKLGLGTAEKTLGDLDDQVKRVAVEADGFELRAKVLRDAMPLAPNEPSTPEREAARLDAARTLALDARLLCTATRLLDAKASGLSEAFTALDALDGKLDKKPDATPIDDAIKLRATCLGLLTGARRASTSAAPAAGSTDTLLEELGREATLEPSRDDRGIVVTLRGVFSKGDSIAKASAETLALLGRVAKAHPGFPLLVVVHSARRDAHPSELKRGAAIAEALRGAGAGSVEVATAGDVRPVVPSSKKGAAARNERIEIVFVAPAS